MALPKPKPYVIYPAVGIARLGTSAGQFSFRGPDVPNPDFTPFPIPIPPGSRFRDPAGNIRRQGVRFRVYRVKWRQYRSGWVPRSAKEVTTADGLTFTWKVTVANFKAYKGPIGAITPATKDSTDRIPNRASETISGVNSPSKDLRGNATFPSSTFPSSGGATSANLLLAQISTDDKGRLVFFSGIGECRNVGRVVTPPVGLFSPGWFDDICDGSVECQVRDATGAHQDAERAWVVTGAPAYAHQIGHLVTLYDVAETIAISKKTLPRPSKPHIVHHISPALRTTEQQRWVTDDVIAHEVPFNPDGLLKRPDSPGALPSSAHQARRHTIVNQLRNPVTVHAHSDRKNPFLAHWYPVDAAGQVVNNPHAALDNARNAPQPTQMPRQIGLTFTLEQYKRFRQWEDGTVLWDHPASGPLPVTLDDIPDGRDQVDALNRAHLGSMVGGSTMPGIEVGWKALETTSWGIAFRPDPSLEPGDFTFSLSVPWPVDFLACRREDVPPHTPSPVRNDWWPAARPIMVQPSGAAPDLWDRGATSGTFDVDWWKTRGFIAKNAAGTSFEEVEKP